MREPVIVKLLVHGIGVGLGGMGVLVGTVVGVVGTVGVGEGDDPTTDTYGVASATRGLYAHNANAINASTDTANMPSLTSIR
jgi:hypothetical protein